MSHLWRRPLSSFWSHWALQSQA